MRLAIQVLGVPSLTAATAALGWALVAVLAEAEFGVCDPKFGCSGGMQLGASFGAIAGFLLGLVLLCLFVAYTGITKKVLSARTTFAVALVVGSVLGIVWAAWASASYV